MQQTRQWHVHPETALNPLAKEQFKGNVFDYCSYTVPVKCKLTVTRNSNDSTRSSILETFKYQVSSRVVQVSSWDITCTVLFISIVTNSRNKSFPQKILRASQNSKLDTRFSKVSSIEDQVSNRDCQLTFERYCSSNVQIQDKNFTNWQVFYLFATSLRILQNRTENG